MTIFVGSENPVKINAVIQAASETWPDIKVTGIDVPSGIPEQPIGDDQTREGAENRARRVLERGLMQQQQAEEIHQDIETRVENQPDSQALGIGLEGGVFEYRGQLWSTVWVAVSDGSDDVWAANGARFQVPPIVAAKIEAGEEMGPIVSHLVGEADVRTKQGMIGVITKGFVDRTEEYTGITKMALGLWYGRGWDAALQ